MYTVTAIATKMDQIQRASMHDLTQDLPLVEDHLPLANQSYPYDQYNQEYNGYNSTQPQLYPEVYTATNEQQSTTYQTQETGYTAQSSEYQANGAYSQQYQQDPSGGYGQQDMNYAPSVNSYQGHDANGYQSGYGCNQ